MTSKPERDRLRAAAMIEAAEQARQDMGSRKDEFLRPGLLQRAVLLDLIHLTESAERTSSGLKKMNPQFPWERMSALRNKGLAHDYQELDLEDVWRFLRDELPRIRRRLDGLKFTEPK